MTPFDLVATPVGLRFLGRRFPCTIGRGGRTETKREGDGATPTGTLRIAGMLYRPDRIRCPADWAVPIGPRDYWSDDSADPGYNTLVRAPHGFSHEALRRADPLYDLVLLTDWNWPDSVPGRGSAIFIHQWRRRGYPTEGCVALARKDLHWIAARVGRNSKVLIRPR